MVELSDTDGHLVLCCKGWYDVKEIGRVDQLARLQAAFCGWSAVECNDRPLEAVADRLFRILTKCQGVERADYLVTELHRWLMRGHWKFRDDADRLSDIEKIILFYSSQIVGLRIKDGPRKIRVKLPKAKKRAARKIIRSIEPFTLDIVRELQTNKNE